MARIAGFVALLLAAGAAALVVFVASAHAASSAPAPKANHKVGMYRDPAAAAPHARHHSGLRKDGGRPAHQLRAQRAGDHHLGRTHPPHSRPRTVLVARHQKSAGVAQHYGITELAKARICNQPCQCDFPDRSVALTRIDKLIAGGTGHTVANLARDLADTAI